MGSAHYAGQLILDLFCRLFAFFSNAKKRMNFGKHFFWILADLASPGDPQNRRKSIKIGVRSPLFCKLALFLDFMQNFDVFC